MIELKRNYKNIKKIKITTLIVESFPFLYDKLLAWRKLQEGCCKQMKQEKSIFNSYKILFF